MGVEMSERSGVIITGASTGIGRACALDLAQRGFQVFAGVREKRAGEALLEEAAMPLEPVILDITKAAQIEAAVTEIADKLGELPLAGLVNNAGITVNGPLEFVRLPDLRRQLEINVVAQVAVTQAFLPMLRESRGRIVLMGSVAGLLGTPGMGPYSMSKHALEAMADVLRLELGPWGMHVALIEPGTIATPIWDKGFAAWDAFKENAPAEFEALYASQLSGIEGLARHAVSKAQPPSVVAEAVAHALTSSRPKARYCIGGQAGQQRLLSWLPDAWRDRLLRKMLRL
jgi:NAD(P)-dependent dehydrogenase (short-subunit alcohol dehydrogenase family)